MIINYKLNYYSLIEEKGIDDILKGVLYLPYSKKYEIIIELLKNNSASKINRALYYFNEHYIKKERMGLKAVGNILKGLCKLC